MFSWLLLRNFSRVFSRVALRLGMVVDSITDPSNDLCTPTNEKLVARQLLDYYSLELFRNRVMGLLTFLQELWSWGGLILSVLVLSMKSEGILVSCIIFFLTFLVRFLFWFICVLFFNRRPYETRNGLEIANLLLDGRGYLDVSDSGRVECKYSISPVAVVS